MDKFKNNKEGKMEELKVKPFPFFKQNFIILNGFPFTGQHTEAKGGTAEAGCGREDSTEGNADSNAGAWWVYVTVFGSCSSLNVFI